MNTNWLLGDFHLNRVGSRRREAHFRPGFAAHQSKSEEKDDGGSGPDDFQRVAAAREMRFLAVVAEAEDGEGQSQLREDENRGGDCESQIVLMINLRANGGDGCGPDRPGQLRRKNVNGDDHERYDD